MIGWDEVLENDSNKIHRVLNPFSHLPFDLVPLVLWQVSTRTPGHGAVPGTGELVVMLPGPLGHQVGVVGGGGVGDGPGAPTVEVAEVVGQHLQLVSGELAVVPQNLMIMMVNINIKTDKLTRLTW